MNKKRRLRSFLPPTLAAAPALAAALLAAALLAPGCSARKTYPDAAPGWHSSNYSVIFGTLRRLPGSTEDAPPVWTVRFGATDDPYRGELALTPPERMVGYSGGERVELRGHLLNQDTTDPYNGRWFVADSIQMWAPYR